MNAGALSNGRGEGWQNGEEEVGERWGDDLNHHGIGKRHDLLRGWEAAAVTTMRRR
jgi:hypothetical protein